MAVKKDNAVKVAIISAVATVTAAYFAVYKKDSVVPPIRFSGRVVDESTLRAIPNAKITIDGSSSGTLHTDSEGLFTIVLPGMSQTIRLRIEVVGFETLERIVNVPTAGTEDFRLKPLGKIRSTPTSGPSQSFRSSAIRVWLNRPTGIYHCPGSHWYGKTKDGVFMSEAEAQESGYKPAYGKPCN